MSESAFSTLKKYLASRCPHASLWESRSHSQWRSRSRSRQLGPRALTQQTHQRSRLLQSATLILALLCAPFTLAHGSKEEPMQAYRQSYWTLVAMNFGPIGAMLKGDIPWDDARVAAFANNVAGMATVDVGRAFGPGTDKGKTRAKPEIWENTDDFLAKYGDFKTAAAGLATAAQSGDKGTVGAAFKKTGGTCKACHDEYKAKDYLY